jgi:hypothetical protein
MSSTWKHNSLTVFCACVTSLQVCLKGNKQSIDSFSTSDSIEFMEACNTLNPARFTEHCLYSPTWNATTGRETTWSALNKIHDKIHFISICRRAKGTWSKNLRSKQIKEKNYRLITKEISFTSNWLWNYSNILHDSHGKYCFNIPLNLCSIVSLSSPLED